MHAACSKEAAKGFELTAVCRQLGLTKNEKMAQVHTSDCNIVDFHQYFIALNWAEMLAAKAANKARN